jgi:AcrR family transcriptional regulator
MARVVGRRTSAIRTNVPGLSRNRIVGTALKLVDRDGLAALSLRKLGVALGVEAMSLYHYFPSKRHLLDALVDHAIESVEIPKASLAPLERLRAICYSYRAMAHGFPKLYPLIALHRLNTPTGVRLIEQVLALVQAVEPDPETMARQFRAMGYLLTGAALDETSGYARGPSAAEPVDDAFVAKHCPRLASVARYFKEPEWDATFAYAVDALMAGLAASSSTSR